MNLVKIMYKRESRTIFAILAVFCASTATVLAEAASQAAESFGDRYIALGLAAALLAFAFFRQKPQQPKPTVATVQESSELPAPVESAPKEAAKPAAVELAVAELAIVELAVVERAVEDDSIDAQAAGRNIVVPVDFSVNSEFSIRLALLWSKPNDRLKVVYCIDLENTFPSENLTPSDLISIHPAFEKIDIKTALHWSRLPWAVVQPLALGIIEGWAVSEFAKLKQTVPMAHRERITFNILYGDPVNQIVNLSENISAKLIVLVAHRHSATDRLISGSHADKLLHASQTPVIVVCEPVKSDFSLPNDILITTDFSAESLPVFLVLADIIQGVKSNITVLTVDTAFNHHPKASAMLAGLEREFRSLGLQLSNVKIKASDVEGGILDYVKTHKPQLIAMSSHGRLGFSALIHPSVTQAILHDAGVPILVVNGHSMPKAETVGSLSDFLGMFTGLNNDKSENLIND